MVEQGDKCSPARGSMLGECLVEVLDGMEEQAEMSPEKRKKVLLAFETAFAEEMSKLPRFWRISVKGTMQRFHLAGQERLFDVSEATVQTPIATFNSLPLRIKGELEPGAVKRRRT
eukprot:CAMPEP_0181464684 /NCGR_PEP_ID=MMETSP1110-20121109/35560_1 /TAXON_ID=174948 /ORGANISM="Symbiodinium sp., Strain CCMP421" /LENGTH=115 /DNA_ID=CAMNT_0023589427 /DNA_START=33 /DNA_END=377 /DNA_ORIENTATION=+